jgi:lipid II:glycine glycyltransferase (peptidoglycan interpeptide bridge formation enzyme)
MTVNQLDPLTDPRWPRFVEQHPKASVFHTREWLTVLKNSYGYEPVSFSTTQNGELSNAVVFCRVTSWLTGSRLVSLPFSDHCQPLAEGRELAAILDHVHGQRGLSRLRYVELRPQDNRDITGLQTEFASSAVFSFQQIDLRPELPVIYKGFHDSCIRRKIKRAERENLVYESGRSEELLQKFCQLLLLTRRRHKLPPQPASWFRNILDSLGDMATIHLLSKDAMPAASIMTLKFKKSLVYKYGCSDAKFNNLGGTPLLFWKVIQQAKAEGLEVLDLGRSGFEDPGLIAFKEHLGAVASELRYFRSPAPKERTGLPKPEEPSFAREALSRMPDSLLAGVGQLFYRHLG